MGEVEKAMKFDPNHTMQRMGASRSGHFQFLGQRRLAPTADAGRYRDMKLHSVLLGWGDPDQALRVAAGILGKRAFGGTAWALQVGCQGCEAFPTMHRTWEPQPGVGLE